MSHSSLAPTDCPRGIDCPASLVCLPKAALRLDCPDGLCSSRGYRLFRQAGKPGRYARVKVRDPADAAAEEAARARRSEIARQSWARRKAPAATREQALGREKAAAG